MITIAAFTAGAVIAALIYQEFARLREHLARLDEQARQAERRLAEAEQARQVMDKAKERAPRYSYDGLETLENAQANLIRALIEHQTNGARIETALAQLGALRGMNGKGKKS